MLRNAFNNKIGKKRIFQKRYSRRSVLVKLHSTRHLNAIKKYFQGIY